MNVGGIMVLKDYKEKFELVNDELVCRIESKKPGDDLKYYLYLNGYASYEGEDMIEKYGTNKVHYIIENVNFDNEISILSYDATIEFINCSFHGQIYFMEANNIIFNNCNYYTDRYYMDYDETPYYLRGKVDCLKFINDNFENKGRETFEFNIELFKNKKLDIINSTIKYDLLNIESDEINIIDSKMKSADKMQRADIIKANNISINNSNILTDKIDINSNLELNNSIIEAREEININSNNDIDISCIVSRIIMVNGIISYDTNYIEKQNARINLINELKKIKTDVNKNIAKKIGNYRNELNNSSIKELVKK